jgi:type IV pilus assembly protein PilC
MLVLFTLAVAFFVLLTYVMPKFAKLFEKANVDLPLPTRITIGLHGFFADYWYFVVGGIAALVAIISYLLRTEEGIYFRDNVFLRIPIIGPLYIKVAMARFTSIFAILHASGIRIIDSMNILAGTIGNTAISRTFDEIKERVKEGEGISEPLKSAKYFPPMVSDMIAIGEESGNLEEMLQDITDHYDDEVEYHVKGLEQVIGPILIVLLAAMVGFFALSIFLPIWEMTKLATD